jgi:DNA-binding transcriptional LysR family regulator
VDLQTRLLRSFVVLAEELHFTRAAARLYITQQALSGQLQQLEAILEVRLVTRTSRKVELTPAGEKLLDGARRVLAELDATVADVRRIAGGATGKLVVGFLALAALELTTPILERLRQRLPNVELEFSEYQYNDVTCGLATGVTDIAFIREPVSLPGLRRETLFVEPRVVVLSTSHPLADRTSVRVEEIIDLPMFASETTDHVWRSFWLLASHRNGVPPTLAPDPTPTILQELQAVAAGQGCMVTAAAAIRYMPRPDLKYVHIEDTVGSEVSLCWHEDRETPLIRTFVDCALEARDQERAIVELIENSV